jgi:hypothetical protein
VSLVQVPVLPVFDPREHLPLRGRIAFQPIGDVHSRGVPTAFERPTKELLGGGFVAAALHEDIVDIPVLIAGTVDRHKHLVQVPSSQ